MRKPRRGDTAGVLVTLAVGVTGASGVCTAAAGASGVTAPGAGAAGCGEGVAGTVSSAYETPAAVRDRDRARAGTRTVDMSVASLCAGGIGRAREKLLGKRQPPFSISSRAKQPLFGPTYTSSEKKEERTMDAKARLKNQLVGIVTLTPVSELAAPLRRDEIRW
jgi:hypothetical protein